jgi:hypothetical protein
MIQKLAFRVGDFAVVAASDVLNSLQLEFADRVAIVSNMAEYSGRIVRIENADETMGYDMEEIEGRWMEDSIVDIAFGRGENPDWEVRASDIYSMSICEQDRKFVEVRDNLKRLHLRFRSNYPQNDVDALNHIASRRCRIAFEHRLGFDGTYIEEKGADKMSE